MFNITFDFITLGAWGHLFFFLILYELRMSNYISLRIENLKAHDGLNNPENVSIKWVNKRKHITTGNYMCIYICRAYKSRLRSLLKEHSFSFHSFSSDFPFPTFSVQHRKILGTGRSNGWDF